jgi:hypothetical protein
MASWLRILPFAALSACAPSILHFAGDTPIAIPGEIPRDSRGEPVWSAIAPMPPGAIPAAAAGMPPAPVAEGSTP